jgi:hypothetical protein
VCSLLPPNISIPTLPTPPTDAHAFPNVTALIMAANALRNATATVAAHVDDAADAIADSMCG